MFRIAQVVFIGMILGCGQSGPQLAKVRGKITYKKSPVKFGTVMYQPDQGKVATAAIQPDGSYELSTIKPADGAIVGKHRVSVTSMSTQSPDFKLSPGQEMPAGKSLIPDKYTTFGTSPLKHVEVLSGDNTKDFDLSD